MSAVAETPTVRTEAELQSALQALRSDRGRHLGELLLRDGVLREDQLETALAALKGKPRQHLGQWLVDQGWLEQAQVAQALAKQLGIPRLRLSGFEVPAAVAALLPDELALQYNVLPLALLDNALVVAMVDPFDEQLLTLLRFYTGHPIEPVLADAEEIGQALNRYYAGAAEQRAVRELRFQASNEPPREGAEHSISHAMGKPVVQLVNAIVLQAIHLGASDVNIRPGREQVNVYFRIDGRLRLIRSLPKNLLPALVARIKITGGMDIAERRLPQDGHTRVTESGKQVDLRLSVMPTINGESVVVRILDRDRGVRPLAQLGFSGQDMQLLRELISFPQGMLLVTGPTGSGKSTTLYAMLQEIRRGDPHIVTVEEPVEYDMDGIEQIQINSAIGYSFAEALRHILRHDPDVIMVGEIRDLETARIANKAALTGHLVLSTLHTNDAASAVTRLIDMGVEPYLLGSTLIGVMAQRLVRLNCPHCLDEETVDASVRTTLGVGADEVFLAGRGCSACDSTGYHGRQVVYELLAVRGELPALVSAGAPAAELKAAAVRAGMVPLTQQALHLARNRLTSLSEVYSVRLE